MATPAHELANLTLIKRSEREGNLQPFFAQLGKIMLLASILFIVGLYLFSFRKKIFIVQIIYQKTSSF